MRPRELRSAVVLFTLLSLVVAVGDAWAEEAASGDAAAEAPDPASRPVEPPDPVPAPTPEEARAPAVDRGSAGVDAELGAPAGAAAPGSGGEPEPAGERESTATTRTGEAPPAVQAVDEERGDAAGERYGHYCADAPEARWVYDHLLVAKYNPLGAEDSGRLGLCAPLITRPGMLYEYTNIEFGMLHAVSPAYFHLGGYFQISPLSILSLRVEATGLIYWNIPLDRSGYFEVPGYRTPIDDDDFPSEEGAGATGWNVNFVANVQARIAMGRLGLIILDSLGYELWKVGEGEHYVNLRHEVVMARFDSLISNEAMLMLEIPATQNISVRVGGYDSLRYVPNAPDGHNLNNSVGLLAMVAWAQNGDHVRGLTPFIRVGWYTDRPTERQGLTTVFLGLLFNVDIAHARYGRAGD
jgi:hypothetical protein